MFRIGMEDISRGICLPAFIAALAITACASPPASTAPPEKTFSPSTAASKPASTWDRTFSLAAQEGALTIYSFNFVGDTGIKLAETFRNRYGIKIEIVTGRGAEFVERLKTEKRLGQKTADLSEGSITNLLQMKAEGLTTGAPDFPVLSNNGIWSLDPLATDTEAHVLNYTPYTVTPWVNTNLVKPGQEPKSFKDLLSPEWKGQIITDDPLTSSSVYLYYVPLVNAGVIDWEYVRALGKQDMQMRTGPIQMTQSLAQGQFPVMLLNVDSIVSPLIKKGSPIRAISMKEGDVMGANGITVIREAANTNAARLFVNWLLDEEGQTLYNSLQATAPVRKDVPDFRPPGARAPSSKLVVTTAKDYHETARLMRERFLAGIWKQ